MPAWSEHGLADVALNKGVAFGSVASTPTARRLLAAVDEDVPAPT
ncbi:hypothetical protein [Streptomyces sp. NPDC051001]